MVALASLCRLHSSPNFDHDHVATMLQTPTGLDAVVQKLLPYGTLFAIVAIIIWGLKLFFGEAIKQGGQRFAGWIFGGPRSFSKARLRKYQKSLSANYCRHPLGFLRDKTIEIEKLFVSLQYVEDGHRADVYAKVRESLRTIVLGAAGGGKSMLLKASILKWSRYAIRPERIPVLVELNRYNDAGSTIMDMAIETFRRNGIKDPKPLLESSLNDGRICLLLDGLDEVASGRRTSAIHEIKTLAESFPKCQVVVTCRDAIYDGGLAPAFDHQVKIAGFDDAAIRRYLLLWYRSQKGADEQRVRQRVAQLTVELQKNPAILRLARSPLLLAMIATIQEADPGLGPSLTNSRADFYREAVDHFLKRDFDLGRHPDVARYRAGHKATVLRKLALVAQGGNSGSVDDRTMTEALIIREIVDVLSTLNMEAKHAGPLLDEIVHRSELLVNVDETNLLYQFAHLTLQEYLAAMELGDDPDRLLVLYRAKPDRWRETVKLWCAGANRDSTKVISAVFAGGAREKILALECLSEAKQVDNDVAVTVIAHAIERLHRDLDILEYQLLVSALGAVSADPGPRGKKLLERLTKLTLGDDIRLRSAAIDALAASQLPIAASVLATLAGKSKAARTALKSMGEQAIPYLSVEAALGSLAAIDDIGEIGTPSAAIFLSELIWHDSPVAFRSAWRIAGLISSPDVEEELRLSSATLQIQSERLDWVWAPFDEAAFSTIRIIMGRVAWLIYNCPDNQVPVEIHDIDARIAMPLGALGAWATIQRDYVPWRDVTLIADIEQILRTDFDRYPTSDLRRLELRPGTAPRIEARVMGHYLSEVRPRKAAAVCSHLLQRGRVRPIYRALLESLPDTALTHLIIGLFWPEKRRVTERHWRRVVKQRGSLHLPFLLALPIACLAAIPAVGATRSGLTSFGVWVWGPSWLHALGIGGSIATVGLLFRRRMLGKGRPPLGMRIVTTSLGITAIAAFSVVGFVSMMDWLGSWWVVAVIPLAGLILAGLAGMVDDYINPSASYVFRAALRWDKAAAKHGSSIISY